MTAEKLQKIETHKCKQSNEEKSGAFVGAFLNRVISYMNRRARKDCLASEGMLHKLNHLILGIGPHLFTLLAFFACAFFIPAGMPLAHAQGESEEPKLTVAATIFPVADMIKQVGGGRVKVLTLVPPGANPHLFEFSSETLRALEKTKAVFVIGRGFDHWLIEAAQSFPEAKILPVDRDIPILRTEGADDPHYWLSVRNAKTIAGNVAGELSAMDPAHKNDYKSRLVRYLMKLDETEREIRSLLISAKGRKLVTTHDAWRYFADEYGLQIAGSLYGSEAAEPTPGRIAKLVKEIRKNKITTLFFQANEPPAAAETFAGDYHLELRELDDIGGIESRDSFVKLMKYNAKTIREALGRE